MSLEFYIFHVIMFETLSCNVKIAILKVIKINTGAINVEGIPNPVNIIIINMIDIIVEFLRWSTLFWKYCYDKGKVKIKFNGSVPLELNLPKLKVGLQCWLESVNGSWLYLMGLQKYQTYFIFH